MPMNTQGRPTRIADNIATGGYAETTSGSKGLEQSEALIYERGSVEQCGVDLPDPKGSATRLGGLERKSELGLPAIMCLLYEVLMNMVDRVIFSITDIAIGISRHRSWSHDKPYQSRIRP